MQWRISFSYKCDVFGFDGAAPKYLRDCCTATRSSASGLWLLVRRPCSDMAALLCHINCRNYCFLRVILCAQLSLVILWLKREDAVARDIPYRERPADSVQGGRIVKCSDRCGVTLQEGSFVLWQTDITVESVEQGWTSADFGPYDQIVQRAKIITLSGRFKSMQLLE